jgi:hypothetical protein
MQAAIANLGDRRRFEHLVGALRTDFYRYTFVPLDERGSIAIVGTPDEDIEIIRDRLQQAVRWRL